MSLSGMWPRTLEQKPAKKLATIR
ncbi:hypothetical protein Tco_1560212, partial [Tanacetum coccineum]